MSGPSTRVNLEYLYREPAARAFRSRNVCLCLFLDSRSTKISEYEEKYRVRIYENAFALNFLTKRSIDNYCRPTVRKATHLSISIPNSFAFGPFFDHRTCVRSFFSVFQPRYLATLTGLTRRGSYVARIRRAKAC